MLNFKAWSGLRSGSLALTLLFASVAASDAQTTLTPPPIPAEEPETAVDTGGSQPPPPPVEATTPPPPPPAEEIFVSIDGSSEGPFTLSELEARVAAGTFSATTFVWEEGMAEWMRAGEVEKLNGILASAQQETATPQAQDIETFLTGIWVDRNTTFVPGLGQVQMDMLIEYYPNGRMDGIGQFTATNNGMNAVYDIYAEGTWSARATTGDAFTLTTSAQVSIGLVESPVYTDTVEMNETTTHERIGPNSFRDVENNLIYTRR